MSNVLELVEVSSLVLGADAICDMESNPSGAWSCELAATWAGVMPCGEQFLACDVHHEWLLTVAVGCCCETGWHRATDVHWRRA